MFETLKDEMKRRDLSGYALAKLANISSQDFYTAIHGKKPFYPGWRKRIAEALEMSEKELFPEYDS